ncbi:MAG: hypothetical protein KDA64_04150 [Rhodospirillaceae bacterium]|nr:hypothetical protein [Rhodospirillaceae bacterium]
MVALAAGGAAATVGEGTPYAIDTADGVRTALLYPAGAGPRPTVIVLHGGMGTGARIAASSGFAEAAAAAGFTAVFPDGLDRRWNDGRVGWRNGEGPDDVAFLSTLADALVADGIALPDRIYLAGISNGGMMSFTMACLASERFAGIGTVIANLPAGIGPCAPAAVPLVMVNGTDDPLVPYGGGGVGIFGRRGEVLGVEQTAGLFAVAFGCGGPTAAELADRDPGDGTTVTRIDWQGCLPGAGVTLYRVNGGGHTVPGWSVRARRLFGASNRDFSAAQAILAIFATSR